MSSGGVKVEQNVLQRIYNVQRNIEKRRKKNEEVFWFFFTTHFEKKVKMSRIEISPLLFEVSWR